MHKGVGKLLLGSEICEGVIREDATRRTAFVIAGGHILTARHCSADATETNLLWLRLPAPAGQGGTVDLPMRIVDEDAALDVAVLEVDSRREAQDNTSGESAVELLGRVPPVPVGLPPDAGELVRTEGHPWHPRTGGIAFTGQVVDPAAQLIKHGLHALQLHIEELAAGIPHSPKGHSGGPVLTAEKGLVVGVVREFPADRTGYYAVGGSMFASRIQDIAARFPSVQDAFARRAREVLGQTSIGATLEQSSLATIIRADACHTRFFGRESELDQLRFWCATNPDRAAMLITGPAGQGKTRLVRHICDQLTTIEDWVAVPLRGVGSVGDASHGLGLAALSQRPLLLAVDYAAEYGATALRALVEQLCECGPVKWRLLLVARQTGDWWDGHSRAVLPGLRAVEAVVPDEPIRLGELVRAGDARQRAYDLILSELRTPVTEFADRRGLKVSATPGAPPLQQPEYGSALMLHIAAVCALLPGAGPNTQSVKLLDPAKVVDRFLDLERDHHWLYRDSENLYHTTTEAFGNLVEGEAGRYRVETAVAAATLSGAANIVQACELTVAVLDVTPQQAEPIAYWLRDLYPPPSGSSTGSILHPLEPDLLGEELVTRVLRRQLDRGITQDRLMPFMLTRIASETQANRILTVLIRAAERHAWVADLLAGPDGNETGQHDRALLSNIPIAVNLSVVDNALPLHSTNLLRFAVLLAKRLLARLDHLHGGGTIATQVAAERARLLNNLANRLADIGKNVDAVASARDAVQLCQRLIDTDSATYLPALALSIETFANRLSDVGQHSKALSLGQVSIDLYQRLAKVAPTIYLPRLAASQSNLAVRLAVVGQRVEALAPAQEAVTISRRLAETNPDIHLPDLAVSLNTLANRLTEVGQHSEALLPAEEAVQIFRRLARDRPTNYLYRLAQALNTLSHGLAGVGQHAKALAPAQEAVQLHRHLVGIAPAAYLPDLVNSLNNLSNRLTGVGQHAEALSTAHEVVQLYRRLAEAAPTTYLHRLAISLNNLAVSLAKVGQGVEALVPAQEAVVISRQLAEVNPAAYLPDLARALNTSAQQLAVAGQGADALSPARESTQIYRRLADTDSAVYLPALAGSLNNLARRLAGVGQQTEALAPAQEAVRLYRHLAESAPAVHLPNLAMALETLASRLAGVERRAEVLAPAQEAVELYRRLSDINPALYLPDLARTLITLVLGLVGVERRVEVLAPAQEAVELYRRLSDINPALYLPALSRALSILAVLLAGLGRHGDARVAKEEVARIRQQLA